MAASKDLLEALIECKKVFKHQGVITHQERNALYKSERAINKAIE